MSPRPLLALRALLLPLLALRPRRRAVTPSHQGGVGQAARRHAALRRPPEQVVAQALGDAADQALAVAGPLVGVVRQRLPRLVQDAAVQRREAVAVAERPPHDAE